jgi:hypothetical protein
LTINIDTYSEDGLDNIKSTSILTDKDLKTMESLKVQLQDTFNKRQIFRTETEARYSVLTDVKFPTYASKYWQCVREQNVHFTNLMYESCDYEEKQGEIELLEEELESITSNAMIKIKKAQIKKKQFELLDMKRVAQDRVREVTQWEMIKLEMIEKDPTFDTKNVDTDQFAGFLIRFEADLAIAKDSGNADLYKAAISQLTTMKNDKYNKPQLT